MDSYLAAKLRLFTELLKPGQPIVVNTDGARSDDVIAAARNRGLHVLTVGSRGEAIRLAGVVCDGFEQRLTLATPAGTRDVLLPLLGDYQVANALVAAGLAIAAGIPPSEVVPAWAISRASKVGSTSSAKRAAD